MKNDYKIGLVIGLLVLFLGVGYFIFRGPGKAKKPEVTTTTAAEAHPQENTGGETTGVSESATNEGGFVAPPPPTMPEETAVPAATETVTPAPAKPADSTLAERVDDWSNRSGNAETTVSEPAATETIAPRLKTGETPAATETVKPAASSLKTLPADANMEWGVPGAENTTPASRGTANVTSVEPVNTTPGTYTVKSGDVGWTIAVEVYGTGMGHYWTLIRDANPNANMSNLKVGQVLTIPPLPENARQRSRDAAAMGTTFTDASGKNIYVTKQGDCFWTIAQKVYGKGTRCKEIQDANPGVRMLRPGLRLVIPGEVATTAATAADETATYGTETVTAVTASSNNYYTVKSGDSLWTIAEKEYGNGAYADLIKKANKNIDADNLRVGQRIVLPPKPEGATTSSTPSDTSTESAPAERRSSTPSSSGSVPSDEPDFGL